MKIYKIQNNYSKSQNKIQNKHPQTFTSQTEQRASDIILNSSIPTNQAYKVVTQTIRISDKTKQPPLKIAQAIKYVLNEAPVTSKFDDFELDENPQNNLYTMQATKKLNDKNYTVRGLFSEKDFSLQKTIYEKQTTIGDITKTKTETQDYVSGRKTSQTKTANKNDVNLKEPIEGLPDFVQHFFTEVMNDYTISKEDKKIIYKEVEKEPDKGIPFIALNTRRDISIKKIVSITENTHSAKHLLYIASLSFLDKDGNNTREKNPNPKFSENMLEKLSKESEKIATNVLELAKHVKAPEDNIYKNAKEIDRLSKKYNIDPLHILASHKTAILRTKDADDLFIIENEKIGTIEMGALNTKFNKGKSLLFDKKFNNIGSKKYYEIKKNDSIYLRTETIYNEKNPTIKETFLRKKDSNK